MAQQYRGTRVPVRKFIQAVVREHVKSRDILEPVENLTLEPRDRSITLHLSGGLLRQIEAKRKIANTANPVKFESAKDYVYQLVMQLVFQHVQTVELQDYNGNKTGREIR